MLLYALEQCFYVQRDELLFGEYIINNQVNKIPLNGVEVYPFASEEELLSFVDTHKGILVAINSKKIKGANSEIRSIVNRNIGYADGAGAVIALKHKGAKSAIKIPGCELWLHIIERLYKERTFYLIGGAQQVIEETVAKLRNEFQGINIVGCRNGYINSDEEKQRLKEDVVSKKPDVVFVAMGSPKQEYLMQELFEKHSAIYQGLGGSFDVYTNKVRRAPKWFSDHNLEGVYRAFWEPKKRIKGVLTDIWFLIALKLGKY